MSIIAAGNTISTGLTYSADQTGSLQLQTLGTTAVTYDTNQNAKHTGSISSVNTFGFKNRIINGAMVIDQRNAGAQVTNTAGTVYTLDRWSMYGSQASKFTLQQNQGSVTPPAGFTNYLGCTSSSAYSVGSGDYFGFQQVVEGLNMSDLAWGTANAKSVSLSFWVRSSLTGTFGGALQNSGASYNFPFSYTISSVNTWTYITIPIVGPTSGTWTVSNTAFVYVAFSLGAGSTWTQTGGAWTSSPAFQATGSTSVVGTSGATFYITGVQLEVGTSATGYEYRQYGTELALCQRYYEKSYDPTTVPGTNSTNGISYFYVARITANAYGYYTTKFQVTKRANPTITIYSIIGTAGTISNTDSGADLGTAGIYYNCPTGFLTYNTSGGNIAANAIGWQYTASAEL
jgi:hypothetical protein